MVDGWQHDPVQTRSIIIPPHGLPGDLAIPADASGLVIFAHGSGSSRLSPRNTMVAQALVRRGLATLLFDLLSVVEAENRENVFDIPLLAERLEDAVRWAKAEPDLQRLPVGLFGASTGGAAALVAAARLGPEIDAVVSRGGRPDLAGSALEKVRAPTLLIVGGEDHGVLELNQDALRRVAGSKAINIVPGATHLFPEPGALEAVIEAAADWFQRMGGRTTRTNPTPTTD